MMLEKCLNITSLHPWFSATCNIGEDKKHEYQTAKKKTVSPLPLGNPNGKLSKLTLSEAANQITRLDQ